MVDTSLSNRLSHQKGNYEYFALSTPSLLLLSEGQQLVIDHLNETATLVDWKETPPKFLQSCTIFEEDLCLLCPLFRAWPATVPYADLIMLLAGPGLAQQVEEAQKAEDKEKLGALLEPLFTRLLTCQGRLALFGLAILPEEQAGLVINAAIERRTAPCLE